MNILVTVKEMPKLVKLAPNGSADRSPLQESKKRKRPIGKSHALITSKPLTIGKETFEVMNIILKYYTCTYTAVCIIINNKTIISCSISK